MAKYIVKMAVALGLLCSPGKVQAHGGGLDANGCHTERSTGTYHCHGASAGPGSGVGGSTTGSLYIAPASVPKSRSINQKLSVQEIRGAVNLVSIGLATRFA